MHRLAGRVPHLIRLDTPGESFRMPVNGL